MFKKTVFDAFHAVSIKWLLHPLVICWNTYCMLYNCMCYNCDAKPIMLKVIIILWGNHPVWSSSSVVIIQCGRYPVWSSPSVVIPVVIIIQCGHSRGDHRPVWSSCSVFIILCGHHPVWSSSSIVRVVVPVLCQSSVAIGIWILPTLCHGQSLITTVDCFGRLFWPIITTTTTLTNYDSE